MASDRDARATARANAREGKPQTTANGRSSKPVPVHGAEASDGKRDKKPNSRVKKQGAGKKGGKKKPNATAVDNPDGLDDLDEPVADDELPPDLPPAAKVKSMAGAQPPADKQPPRVKKPSKSSQEASAPSGRRRRPQTLREANTQPSRKRRGNAKPTQDAHPAADEQPLSGGGFGAPAESGPPRDPCPPGSTTSSQKRKSPPASNEEDRPDPKRPRESNEASAAHIVPNTTQANEGGEEEDASPEPWNQFTTDEIAWPGRWKRLLQSLVAENIHSMELATVRTRLQASQQRTNGILGAIYVPRRRQNESILEFARRCARFVEEQDAAAKAEVERQASKDGRPLIPIGGSGDDGDHTKADMPEEESDDEDGHPDDVEGEDDWGDIDAAAKMRRHATEQRALGSLQPIGFRQNQQIDLAGQWNFNGIVGSGSFACAGRWTQFDKPGKTCRSIVLKDSYIHRKGKMWDDDPFGDFWHGPPTDREPKEHFIQQRLNDCPESYNIVQCHAYSVHPAKRMVRLYLEDCPHGDLEGVIIRHAHVRDSIESADGSRLPYYVPPAFIWCVFEALASAVCFMNAGRLPIHGFAPVAGWKAILHRDIKPANIFLGAPNERVWPGMPVPKLGDFGTSMEIDEQNPPDQSGTRSYVAPELRDETDEAPASLKSALRDTKRRTGSDIWSVGRVIHSLMHLNREVPPKVRELVERAGVPDNRDAVMQFYMGTDPSLVNLMGRCLQLDPRRRPAASELFWEVQHRVGIHRDFSLTRPLMKTQPLSPDVKLWCQQAKNDLWLPE